MSVFKRGGVWWYDFTYKWVRHRRSTGQTVRDDAEQVERDEKTRARRAARGLIDPDPASSPTFQDWAEIYYVHARDRAKLGRPDRVEQLIRRALWFWGTPSARAPRTTTQPRHDLRLGDVVADPRWILKWETWLEQPKPAPGRSKGSRPAPVRMISWSGQTKNQYRSLLSQMFKLAMSPPWRLQTGIVMNPFAGGYRDRTYGRDVALEREDLAVILSVASYHLRLAVAIGLLAPKLREGNILRLRFDRHVSADCRYITVQQHKTRRTAKRSRPLVAYVPDQLREILLVEKARKVKLEVPWVITLKRKPVKSLRGAVRGAIRRAAESRPHLVYGRSVEDGVTFHTIRHTAATLLAELEVSPEKRQALLQHERLETTMRYTHLRPKHEAPAAEQLSAALPIKALVLAPRIRAVGTPASRWPRTRAESGAHRPTASGDDGTGNRS